MATLVLSGPLPSRLCASCQAAHCGQAEGRVAAGRLTQKCRRSPKIRPAPLKFTSTRSRGHRSQVPALRHPTSCAVSRFLILSQHGRGGVPIGTVQDAGGHPSVSPGCLSRSVPAPPSLTLPFAPSRGPQGLTAGQSCFVVACPEAGRREGQLFGAPGRYPHRPARSRLACCVCVSSTVTACCSGSGPASTEPTRHTPVCLQLARLRPRASRGSHAHTHGPRGTRRTSCCAGRRPDELPSRPERPRSRDRDGAPFHSPRDQSVLPWVALEAGGSGFTIQWQVVRFGVSLRTGLVNRGCWGHCRFLCPGFRFC